MKKLLLLLLLFSAGCISDSKSDIYYLKDVNQTGGTGSGGSCDNNAACTGSSSILGAANQTIVENGPNTIFGPLDVIIRTVQDINTNSLPTFAGLITTDGNSIYILPSLNVILFGDNSTPGSIVTNSPDLQFQSNDLTGSIWLTGFNAIQPLVNNTVDLGGINHLFRKAYITDANIAHDLNIHNNLRVDQNIYGQVFGGVAAVGTSCTTICDGFDTIPLGSNWSCIAATSQTGIASTCGDTNTLKNCMCKN